MFKCSKKVSIVLVSIIILVAAYLYLKIDLVNNACIELLNSYGWDVLVGGLSDKEIMLTGSYPSEEIFDMRRSASAEIGLNPDEYIGSNINVYSYVLEQKGFDDNLGAHVWVYEKQIICAYIYHFERNLRIRYWPLSTPIDMVISDIIDMRNSLKH